MKAIVTILVLAFLQNVSFSIVSRSRNRSNFTYHMIASVFSNGVWFLTFRQLVMSEMNWVLFLPYTIGTVIGSLTGTRLSMWIERWLGAASDDHLVKQQQVPISEIEIMRAFMKACKEQGQSRVIEELAEPSPPPRVEECGRHLNGPIFCNLPSSHSGSHNRLRPAGTVIQ